MNIIGVSMRITYQHEDDVDSRGLPARLEVGMSIGGHSFHSIGRIEAAADHIQSDLDV